MGRLLESLGAQWHPDRATEARDGMRRGGNVESILRTVIVVGLAIVVIEWIHYRVGAETLWDLARHGRMPVGPALPAGDGAQRVTENDFDLYIQVLETMQADHELTVDKAVESAKLTLSRFRGIESRVQRDPMLVNRTRELLRKKAEDLWATRSAS